MCGPPVCACKRESEDRDDNTLHGWSQQDPGISTGHLSEWIDQPDSLGFQMWLDAQEVYHSNGLQYALQRFLPGATSRPSSHLSQRKPLITSNDSSTETFRPQRARDHRSTGIPLEWNVLSHQARRSTRNHNAVVDHIS